MNGYILPGGMLGYEGCLFTEAAVVSGVGKLNMKVHSLSSKNWN
jgi:hypothetical protein